MYKLLVPFFIFFLLSHTPSSFAENMIASGCSVSSVGYLADLCQEYEKETGVRISVLGGGSVRGLVDLLNNRVDFAASCKAKEADDPADLDFIPVAWDALVFIVNKSNPVNNITPKNVRDIYEGKIKNWKQLRGHDMVITSFISTTKGMGGIGQSLSKMILNGRPVSKQPNSVVLASSVAIWEQMVEKTPEGFASTGFASARKREVKMLRLNGIEPSKKNILSGRYPLRRPLYLVVKKDPKPEVRKFIDYVLSSKGQGFIASYGIPALSELK
ncbi:MAG: phosphate ABC transporter substrate-binding protein [Nitrospirae bacterium]|nr:phosphate ABC transporter substrate-binding protein [Nitrospirota bacterium]